MVNGAFTLLERSLRIDARSWAPHVTRLGLAATIYFSLCYVLTTQHLFGAPGFHFFEGIAYIDMMLITLLGIGFFSTAITEEKEEDTLGLMLMAGISPMGLLLGKSVGRLWQAVLLVAVQYPFTLLAVTMGGITNAQIWSTTVALLSYMLFLAGYGLLCSTLAPRSRTAGAYMIVGIATYIIVPTLAYSLKTTTIASVGSSVVVVTDLRVAVLEWIADTCLFVKIDDILTTGFNGSPWTIQAISNIGAGLCCAGLSWLLFGFAARNPSTEASPRGLVARRRAFLRFVPGRPKLNPFVWKDFHFVAGGSGSLITRSIYFVALLFLVITTDGLGTATGGFDEVISMYLVFASLSVAIDAGIVLARSMYDEVRGHTLAALVMLPRSSTGIVYAKFAGALLGWLPGPIIELIVTLSTQEGRQDLKSMFSNQEGYGMIFVFLMLSFSLIPHFSALISLYVRWGAVPLATCLAFGALMTIQIGFEMIGVYGDAMMSVVGSILLSVVCVGCHIAILLRVQALGAR